LKTGNMNLVDIRQFFAEEIRTVANIQTDALADAFAKVPREHFLGPGPWQIASADTRGSGAGAMTIGTSYRPTADADPRHLYHNVLIAIDPDRQLNNGHPSTLASWLDELELKEGDRVLHIGCGVGYYTAIIAEVVGPAGHVTGIEIDADLASRARKNLAHLNHVEVLQADGGEYNSQPGDVIFINAGATHLRSAWLDNLLPGGRLLLPLTVGADAQANSMGLMLKVTYESQSYAARFLSPVMIFPCIGSRDEESNQRLRDALKLGTWGSVQSLRRESHESNDSCWLHGETFCLSTLPAAASSARA
jgi:protein-L-isoaspartate(D-aspartate) O-methyltransferase